MWALSTAWGMLSAKRLNSSEVMGILIGCQTTADYHERETRDRRADVHLFLVHLMPYEGYRNMDTIACRLG